jgi:oligoendopeptidase F
VKELRQVHSTFMTDFHQAVGYFVQENARLQAELNKWTNSANSLQNDVLQLEDVVHKLNQVKLCLFNGISILLCSMWS